jgi:hypothetical protein
LALAIAYGLARGSSFEKGLWMGKKNSILCKTIGCIFLSAMSGCAIVEPSRPADRAVVESQIGPIAVEARGFAGGLTHAEFTHLVLAGVKQGCPQRVELVASHALPPSLSMVWSIERAGTRPPAVIITVRLLSDSHPVGFSVAWTHPRDIAPHVVFEYVVAGITCSLFTKAGFLQPSSGDD